MPHPLVQALIAHFDSVFEGPNGDYSAVLEAVAGVSVTQALWKPTPTQNSIWQIVEHLIASKEWQIEMLEHGQATSPAWVEPSGDEFRRSFAAQISQFFALFDAMVWIAVIVGTLGVINTMTMNILERVREIGTMRSIGLSRRQLAQLVLAEAGAMGALGAVFGLAVALPVSTVMVTGMAQGSGFQMSYVFPRQALVTGVAIALIVSQAAALYPAWRAGRINVIEAIRSE